MAGAWSHLSCVAARTSSGDKVPKAASASTISRAASSTVTCADPQRIQRRAVRLTVREPADAHADDREVERIDVVPAERLAKGFADAIQTVRANSRTSVDWPRSFQVVKAHDVVGRREDDL